MKGDRVAQLELILRSHPEGLRKSDIARRIIDKVSQHNEDNGDSYDNRAFRVNGDIHQQRNQPDSNTTAVLAVGSCLRRLRCPSNHPQHRNKNPAQANEPKRGEASFKSDYSLYIAISLVRCS